MTPYDQLDQTILDLISKKPMRQIDIFKKIKGYTINCIRRHLKRLYLNKQIKRVYLNHITVIYYLEE